MPNTNRTYKKHITDHNNFFYRLTWESAGNNKFNGAYYYSKEIVERIIPNVQTDRGWITINARTGGFDGAIVFIHNNLNKQGYEWLKKYKDLILVCGIPETCEKVKNLGTPIYLPLSINVEEVRKYKIPKKEMKGTAFIGRKAKRKGVKFPQGTKFIEGLPREELLKEMAKYKNVYAVGRTAIEAKALGCQILPYDERFPDVERWQVLDNIEAAEMLQKELDRIDK